MAAPNSGVPLSQRPQGADLNRTKSICPTYLFSRRRFADDRLVNHFFVINRIWLKVDRVLLTEIQIHHQALVRRVGGV